MQLRPHQRTAARAAADALARGGRGQVIMPCGTGKTLVAVAATAMLQAQLVLVVVPTLALIRQTAAVWTTAYGEPLRVLFACSDANLAEPFEASAPDQKVTELHAPVTTDVVALTELLANWSQDGTQTAVAFATYASLDRVLRAADMANRRFDIAIADEAHHCAGDPSAPWAALAHPGAHHDAIVHRRLFLTATPRRSDSVNPPKAEMIAMDDPSAFGPVVHEMTVAEAIGLGLLSDYRIAVVGMTPKQWPGLGGPNTIVPGIRSSAPYVLGKGGIAQTEIAPEMLATTFALGRAMAHFGLRRVLTFHGRVRDARTYAAAAPALLQRLRHPNSPSRITAAAVHADIPADRRAKVLSRFADADDQHAVIVTNVRCLSEGVDIPSLDAVLFADPRRGLVDVVQAVGRVMRPHRDKAFGTVVLPLVLPAEARRTPTSFERGNFSDLIHVLRILREHDTTLGAQLDEMRRATGRSRNAPILPVGSGSDGPLRLLLPRGLPDAFVRGFTLRLLRHVTTPWEERYGTLQRWVSIHGHGNVPVAEVLDGVRLGGWVHEQRSLKARGLLPARRGEQLEQLPGWTWTAHDAAWERAFSLLLAYVAKHGTSRVPQTYRADGFALGAWVKAQRELHQRGRLATRRAERLSTLPGWVWRKRA